MRTTRRSSSGAAALGVLAAGALLAAMAVPLPAHAEVHDPSVEVPDAPDWSLPGAGPERDESVSPSEGWEDRYDAWVERVTPGMINLGEEIFNRDRAITSDHLSQLASARVRVLDDPDGAWEALQLMFDHQDMDPASPEYGRFAHQIWDTCWYGTTCYELGVAPYTRTTVGSWASLSQEVEVEDAPEHMLSLKLRTNATYQHARYHAFQILVDDEIVYEEDAARAEATWRDIEVDVSPQLEGKLTARIELRLYATRAVVQHPISIRFDAAELTGTTLDGRVDTEGVWMESTQGEGVHLTFGSSGGGLDHTSFILSRLAGIMNSTDMEQFTPEQQELLKERARLASWSQIEKDNMVVGYTNMRIARDVQTILIGQATGDEALYQRGVELWREWLEFTRDSGIREYGSVTYYGVSVIKLMAGHSYVADDALRAEFAQALDLFWFDMAANWFPGHNSVSGSQSRNYNFTHPGSPRTFTSIEGWEPMPEPMTEQQKASAFGGNFQVVQVFYGDHVYHPTRDMYDLAMAPVKEVEAITEEDRFLDRYNYVTPHWAIGSTSQSFLGPREGSHPSPYDKAINMEFEGDRNQGSLAVVPSWNTDPYGKERYHHAPLWPTTAQHQGSVLTQLDLNPSGRDLDSTQRLPNFSTHVLVPGNADFVVIDGEPVDISTVGETRMTTESTMTMRVDQACVAVRVLGVEGVNGHQPTASLIVDEAGLQLGMARLTLEQFAAPEAEVLTTESAPVTLFIQAADCRDDQAVLDLGAAVSGLPVGMSADDGTRTASITTPSGDVLEVVTDTIARRPLSRSVNGEPVLAPSILTVNGKDYSHVIQPAEHGARAPAWEPGES